MNNELLKQDLLGRSKNNENAESNIMQKNVSNNDQKPLSTVNQAQQKQSTIATSIKRDSFYQIEAKKPLTENNLVNRIISDQKEKSIDEVQVNNSEIKIKSTIEDKDQNLFNDTLGKNSALSIKNNNNKPLDINKSIENCKLKIFIELKL